VRTANAIDQATGSAHRPRIFARKERKGTLRCSLSMARYFFALTNGDSISDDIGEEFDG
jgi:hypothetical protein